MGRSSNTHRSGLLLEFNSRYRPFMGPADVQSRLSYPHFCRVSDPISGEAIYQTQQQRIVACGWTFDSCHARPSSSVLFGEFHVGSHDIVDRPDGGIHVCRWNQGVQVVWAGNRFYGFHVPMASVFHGQHHATDANGCDDDKCLRPTDDGNRRIPRRKSNHA